MQTYHDQIDFTQLRGVDRKVDQVLKRLSQHPGLQNLPLSLKRDLKLAMVEGLTNAFRHGMASRKLPAKLKIRAHAKNIGLEIQDQGEGFSLKSALKKRPEELATCGRGLWILKGLMDRVVYQRASQKEQDSHLPNRLPNRLILERRLTRPKNFEAALELWTQFQISLQSFQPIATLHEQLLDFLLNFFNVERVSLLTQDHETGMLKIVASRGLSKSLQKKIVIRPGMGMGVAGYVFSTGRALLISDAAALKKRGLKSLNAKQRKKVYRSQSFMSVPLTANPNSFGEQALGVLNLTEPRDGKNFSSQDLKLLQLMATQAAGAFHLHSLMQQVREQESLRRELEIVAEIQNRLLPKQFPQLKGTQLAGQYELSPLGGGDYYDVFQRGTQIWGVIADVSGHNVASALTMATFRTLVRQSALRARSPGQWLQQLRREMQPELDQSAHFISAWTFCLNAKGELILSGAAHPPVLHFVAPPKKKTKQESWQEYPAKHLLLGLPEQLSVQNKKIKLAKGDWLFFYTDGLFDPHMHQTGWDQQVFQSWVEERLKKRPKETPEHLLEELFVKLKKHRRVLKHPDDVVVVALRKN